VGHVTYNKDDKTISVQTIIINGLLTNNRPFININSQHVHT